MIKFSKFIKENNIKRLRIYVDMDGTICDIKSAYRKVLENPKNELEKKYPQSRIGLFVNLDPIPGAIESMEELQKNHDVWILTRPSFKNINSYSEKAEWVLKHLGYEMQKKLILCPDKSLVKGDVLIDDMTMDGQTEFEGIFIHFGTEKFPNWKSVMEYVKTLS